MPAKMPDRKDFISYYTPITSLEQRHCYKEDFNSNYAEYRQLHTIVAKVSNKFAELEQRLLSEEKDSESWKKIKDQILKEYHETNKDKEHIEARERFQYLHDMLSHIKKLVLEYDAAHAMYHQDERISWLMAQVTISNST